MTTAERTKSLAAKLTEDLMVVKQQDEETLAKFAEQVAFDIGRRLTDIELEAHASKNLDYIRADTRIDFIEDLMPRIKALESSESLTGLKEAVENMTREKEAEWEGGASFKYNLRTLQAVLKLIKEREQASK